MRSTATAECLRAAWAEWTCKRPVRLSKVAYSAFDPGSERCDFRTPRKRYRFCNEQSIRFRRRLRVRAVLPRQGAALKDAERDPPISAPSLRPRLVRGRFFMAAGLFFLSVLIALSSLQSALAATPAWLDAARSPEERAALVLRELTEDEKLTLVFGYFGSNYAAKGFAQMSEARAGSAGYVRGIPRLGIPPLWETDAGLGVATQRETPTYRERTSLPSGLAIAASWNPELAYSGGAMIGSEARDSGFNVMLAGGLNLTREPRNGRNFEYAGEDPLLAGVMVGEQVRGIQSRHVIATVKHFALNDQETGRKIG